MMKITRNHLQYWQQHHPPGWARWITRRGDRLRFTPDARWRLLMACINQHADPAWPRGADLELANTVTLIRHWRDFREKHGTRYDLPGEPTTLHGYVEKLGRDGAHAIRQKYCRRWLRRIGILGKLTARDYEQKGERDRQKRLTIDDPQRERRREVGRA